MSMVLQQLIDLKDDDYSTEVFKLARARSPNVDNWFLTGQYMLEAFNAETVTPIWLRNKSLIKIINEDFDILGVRINQDADVLVDQVDKVYLILTLRAKLDPASLFNLFRSHLELAEDVASCDGDYIGVIASWCQAHAVLDDGWDFIGTTIDENPDFIESLPKMKQLIDEVLEKVYVMGAPDVSVEAPNDLVVKMLQLLAERQAKIRKLVDEVWCNAGCNEFAIKSYRNFTNKYFETFESELGRRTAVSANAYKLAQLNVEDEDAVRKFIADLRQPYLHKWKHCVEYYLGETTTRIADTVAAIMFATLVVDEIDRGNVRANVEYHLRSNADQLGEGVNALLELFHRLFCHITVDRS